MKRTHSIVTGTDHTPITCHRNTSHTNIILRNQLVAALVLSKVPDPDITSPVATNKLALIRMNNHIIDRNAMGIVALHISAPRIPDLDRAVFARRD